MFVCDVLYCDFCLLTFDSSEEEPSLFVERIQRNEPFWDDCVVKSEQFFVTCLLPEILGHWYTRPAVTTSNDLEGPCSSSQLAVTTGQSVSRDQNNEDDMTYCICNGPDEGTMICCDNDNCEIKWYHLKCLKMSEKSIPKGKWYCPNCRKNKGKSVKK